MSGKGRDIIISYGYDNKTITHGKNDGRFKIYNKKIESNLNIPGDLTRIEISRELDDFPIEDLKLFSYGNMFPSLYLSNYLYSFNDYKDTTLLAILYAVQNGFPLKDLSRRYKEKIKTMLEGGYQIKFSDKTATQIIREVIFFYFMKNDKVRWR